MSQRILGSGSTPQLPHEFVGFLLRSLHHGLRQSMEEALRERGIEMSFAHFAALLGLYLEPGLSGAQLARRSFVSAQTMNAALHRLERDGMAKRRPHSESRRAESWSLTAPGRERLDRAREVGDQVFSKMLSALDPDEVERFKNYLERCIAALGKEGP